MAKISVIIPVYNAEEYLERCLDSVCGQTLKDIEILCINDCSTDNSLEILNRYAQKDSRIFVIDCKVNGGESKARNLGIEKASGGFIAFVDNDDFIDLDFYEKLYKKAKETNADMVKGDVVTVEYNGKPRQSYLHPVLKQTKNKWCFNCEWWSAIYRTTIIKNNEIRLPEGYILGGDVLFLTEALYYANKLQLVDDTAYHWIRRENSGESAVLNKEKMLSALTISDNIQKNINVWYSQHQIDAESYDIITKNGLWLMEDHIFRNDQPECKKICAEHFIMYYQNCRRKNIVEIYLQEKLPYLYLSIIKTKKEELYNKILMIKDRDDLVKKNKLAKMRINTMKEYPKVSIIIPVYNVELYLKRCLNSVCNQTLKELEIICVNDCSMDNSFEILKEYAQKDARIKIIDFKENKGVSAARNAGISSSRGEYIGFVDADDYIELDFYEKLYTKAREVGADIVKANVEIHKVNNTKYLDSLNNEISSNGKFYFLCYFFTAIYSRKMLLENDIKFPEGYCLGEDVYFLSCAVIHANTVDFINNTLYYYMRRENSADSEVLNEKQVMSVVKIYDMLTDNFNAYITVKPAYEFAYFYWYRSLFQILKNNSKYSDILFQYLIRLYEKCLHKNELLLKLQNVFGKIESDFIKNGDKDKLIEYYSKYNTEQKRRIAALRSKITLKK